MMWCTSLIGLSQSDHGVVALEWNVCNERTMTMDALWYLDKDAPLKHHLASQPSSETGLSKKLSQIQMRARNRTDVKKERAILTDVFTNSYVKRTSRHF